MHWSVYGGINMTVGVITALNFVGSGNTFLYDASTQTVDISIAGGGVGTGTDKVFYENDQTVTQSTISVVRTMVAVIAIASGKTVTIPSCELTIV